jgi:hypothetical protein
MKRMRIMMKTMIERFYKQCTMFKAGDEGCEGRELVTFRDDGVMMMMIEKHIQGGDNELQIYRECAIFL